MMFGLYKSLLGFAIITASTLAASAVLNKAPILPGFSGASATKISGLIFFRIIVSILCFLHLATAIMPSVVSLCANF